MGKGSHHDDEFHLHNIAYSQDWVRNFYSLMHNNKKKQLKQKLWRTKAHQAIIRHDNCPVLCLLTIDGCPQPVSLSLWLQCFVDTEHQVSRGPGVKPHHL